MTSGLALAACSLGSETSTDETAPQVRIDAPANNATWNTLLVTNNTVHVIRVEALDLAKHVASDAISVTVVNGQQSPPAVPR